MDIVNALGINKIQRRFPSQCRMRSISLKGSYPRLDTLIHALTKYRSLEDVLLTLNACKMTSTRKRDRFARILKRGELQRAVKKCGQSLETFKVRTAALKLILVLTGPVDYASS
jgi:hypothetical protein